MSVNKPDSYRQALPITHPQSATEFSEYSLFLADPNAYAKHANHDDQEQFSRAKIDTTNPAPSKPSRSHHIVTTPVTPNHPGQRLLGHPARGAITMALRLGDLLVQYGVLTTDQCDLVVKEQRTNPRPFGLLAEELFDIDPTVIEHAWAAQFAMISPRVDPNTIEPNGKLQSVITSRQAWQFGFIPIERHEEGLVCVTSIECLARALRFVGWRVEEPCSFVICDQAALESGLSMHYPMDGVDSEMMNRFLSRPPAA